MDNHNDDKTTQSSKEEKRINVLAFFMFGFSEYATYGAVVTASEDILANTGIPTLTTILVANGPYFILSLVFPYFINKVPVVWRVWLSFLCFASGILVLGLAKSVSLRLLGIGINSVGYVFVEAGLLPITAFYSESCFFAFSGGTGLGIIGAIYYTVLTTWCCISPSHTLLSLVWAPLVFPIFYYLMEKKHNQNSKIPEKQDINQTPYTPLETSTDPNEIDKKPGAPLPWNEKFQIVKSLLPHGIIFFLGETGQYGSLGGLATTLAFPSKTISPRDHFVYYATSFAMGELIGRSYGYVALCLKRDTPCTTKHIWVFTLIIWIDVVFLFCASWYRFLTIAWVVILVIFTVGLSSGALYCNAFALAGKGDESANRREFARSVLVATFAGGIVCGSVLGVVSEPLMRAHCMEVTTGQYCITRTTRSWNSTACWHHT